MTQGEVNVFSFGVGGGVRRSCINEVHPFVR